ncbi:MAG: exonuclease SbcCD subunit D C-terminal domain-containing protein [Eubacteriales bacterium]|nr:exonuclease SbcCD subunit D C-terminal domain-containing protein [Eubacteriales bacterium]
MKILHTSDWHIGHTLYAKKRNDEHEKFLCWLREQIAEREADALIVSGDVFDTGVPGGAAQRLYYDFLTSVLGTCCRTVVIIAGNHDSPGLLEAPAGVLERLSIHIIGLPSAPERHVIAMRGKDGEVGALCCAVPYLRKNEMVRIEDDAVTSDEKIAMATAKFYSDVTQAAISAGEKLPIIATGHLFVTGAMRHDGDGVRDLYVGNLGQVGADIFPKELSYVALGHIHSEQCAGGEEHIRYSGSPLPMSFGEIGKDKFVLEIDTDDGMRIGKITVPVFQQLRAIRGDHETIMRALKGIADDDVWVEVTYTGDGICPGLSADIHTIVKDGKAEVLSIRNNAVLKRILASSGGGETLESMKVQDVFIKCIENNTFEDKHKRELIDCFDEIVAALEGGQSCG